MLITFFSVLALSIDWYFTQRLWNDVPNMSTKRYVFTVLGLLLGVVIVFLSIVLTA